MLDAAVEEGTFTGVTAAVIVADHGSWAGAAGSLDGTILTPDSAIPTHSAGKNVVAAQVLRLVEDGMLGLDDQASDHLPPALSFFAANGATIREVLVMRSGIPDLKEFTAEGGFHPAERASTAVEVLRRLPEPKIRPGSKTGYASTNYVLLGTIIEHATGRPLNEVLRSDVLDRPGLEGLVYTVGDALAADGYGVESTPASLARWGHELYGGFVLSDPSLREMTDFYQDPCCDMRTGSGSGITPLTTAPSPSGTRERVPPRPAAPRSASWHCRRKGWSFPCRPTAACTLLRARWRARRRP